MIRTERVLEAGSESWTTHVDSKIEECRVKDLPTPAERETCIKPTQTADIAVAAALTAATAGLRAYWIGVSIGEKPAELREHVLDVIEAIESLPVENFAGLKKIAK